MSRWEEWQRARRMRDGQESEKRRGDGLPERRRRVDRGGDEARELNRRACARGPGQSRARFTTRHEHASLLAVGMADGGNCIPRTYVEMAAGGHCILQTYVIQSGFDQWTIYGRLLNRLGLLLDGEM